MKEITDKEIELLKQGKTRIKIISDGTPENTHVIDIETGKEIWGITEISFKLGIDDIVSEVHLTMIGVPFEITGVSVTEVREKELEDINFHLGSEKGFRL